MDPIGSILAQPESLNGPGAEGGQQTEGVGYDFIPRVIDRTLVDDWIKAPCKESFLVARRMIREEGLLCGGSSGTNMWACLEYIKEHKIGKGKRCVVVAPDNIRNYMTKFLNADWMYERHYITEEACAQMNVSNLLPNTDWGQDMTIADLNLPDAVFVEADNTFGDVINLMKENNCEAYPVREKGKVIGAVTQTSIMSKLVKNKYKLTDPIKDAVSANFDLRRMTSKVTLNELARVMARNKFALVDDKHMVTVSNVLEMMNQKMEGAK